MKRSGYRKALVYFKDLEAGVLEECETGFRFIYDEDFKKKGIPVSISLPLSDTVHESRELFAKIFLAAKTREGTRRKKNLCKSV